MSRQHVPMHLRDHCLGFRNHRFGVRNRHVGINRQLGLERDR